MPAHGKFDYINEGQMKNFLLDTLNRLEMDDPIQLNKQVIDAEEKKDTEEKDEAAEQQKKRDVD